MRTVGRNSSVDFGEGRNARAKGGGRAAAGCGRAILAFVVALVVLSACSQGRATNKKGGETKGSGARVVKAFDFRFDPKSIEAGVGKALVLEIENRSTLLHNFSITVLNLDRDIPPGEKASLTVTATSSGPIEFFCKYHVGQNMKGFLEVSEK